MASYFVFVNKNITVLITVLPILGILSNSFSKKVDENLPKYSSSIEKAQPHSFGIFFELIYSVHPILFRERQRSED